MDQPVQHGPRIAFFGGSFDPPHIGHLAVARAARLALHLDKVLFAPVGAQPLKPEGASATFEQRAAMTRLAIGAEPGFELSLADAPRSGEESAAPNYTIDTLQQIRATLSPRSTLFCLMGADSFFSLAHWHRAAEIPFAAPLVVASRPGQPLDGLRSALPPGLKFERVPEADQIESGVELRVFTLANAAGAIAPFYLLPNLDVPVSATEIRARIRSAAAPAATFLPPQVAAYIHEHNLYR